MLMAENFIKFIIQIADFRFQISDFGFAKRIAFSDSEPELQSADDGFETDW